MSLFYCDVCKTHVPDSDFAKHVVDHKPTAKKAAEIVFTEIPGADMEFIPEVEKDEVTGKTKKTFKQSEWKPLTDYGG